MLLIHGDDDRNVRFGQTVDLARRLSAAGVAFEELAIPDDTHHWMRHANAVGVYQANADWFRKFLGADAQTKPQIRPDQPQMRGDEPQMHSDQPQTRR